MTDPDLTAIAVVLDRSGSMGAIQQAAERGLNSFIDEQKVQPGRALFTLAQFDEIYELVYDNVPLETVGHAPLVPRGGTALWDAIGKTVVTLGERLKATPEPERPGKVIVVILTDGLENRSREWKDADGGCARLVELIKRQREEWAWEFVYLSASESAVLDADEIGVDRAHTHAFAATAASASAAYASVGETVSTYRQSGKVKLDPGEPDTGR